MGSLVLDNGVSLNWEPEGVRQVRVTIKRPNGTGMSDTVSRAELKRLMKDEIKAAKEHAIASNPRSQLKWKIKAY